MKNKMKLCSALLSIGIIASSLTPAFAEQQKDSFIPEISLIDNVQNPTFIAGKLTETSNETPDKIVENYYSKDFSHYEKSNTVNMVQDNMQLKKSKEFKKVEEFRKKNQPKDKGCTVVKTIQTYNGIPVFGTDQNFNVNDNGIIECIVGSSVDNIEDKIASPESAIQTSKQDALSAVEKHLGFKPEYTSDPELGLELYPVEDKYVYAYKVNIDYNKPSLGGFTYYVDANSLKVLKTFNHIMSDEQAATGTGIGQFENEIKDLNLTCDDSGTYYLENKSENFSTANMSDTRYSEKDNFFNSGTSTNYQQDAVDAHYNVTKVIKFFKDTFNRPSYRDNYNARLSVYINEASTEHNAYANGSSITFLAGHGTANRSMACCLDVAAHEFTHNVLRAEGLQFSGFSGTNDEYTSLHEGLADVFGAICEYFIPSEGSFDWDNAEDSGNPVRDSANPTIDDYSKFLAQQPESHYGGGVITKAAYLIANGGNHNGKTVAAISDDEATAYTKLAKIFYDVIDNNITPYMTLPQFAQAAVYSAGNLYPDSTAAQTVSDAFNAVGIIFSAAPANLRETGRNGSTLSLSWDGTAGETYAIYKSGSQTLTKCLETTNCTASVEVELGSTDFYVAKVNPADGSIISAYSNVVKAVNYTAAPTNFVMTGRNGKTVSFSWDGTPGESYYVYDYVNGVLVNADTTSDTTISMNLSVGTNNFYVAKVNSRGGRISELSNVVSIDNYLAAPSNFVMTSRYSNMIYFGWDGTAGNYYQLYRKITESSDIPEKLSSPTTNTTCEGTTFSGSYDFYIAQVDAKGNRISEFSNVVTVETLSAAPTNFAISSKNGMQVQFSWDNVPGAYAIYRRATGSTGAFIKVESQISGNTGSVVTLPGSYDYCLATVGMLGYRASEFSNLVTVVAYSEAPTNFEATGNRVGMYVQFDWDGAQGETYGIYRKVTGTTDPPVKVKETTSYIDTAVTLQGSCDFYLAKVDSAGNRISEFSNAVTIVT